MAWIEIALPGTLLIAKFLLKLFVDRSATLPDFISAVLALPVDIVFLAASLFAAHAITSSAGSKVGLVMFALSLCLALVIVVMWRRSESMFVRDSRWRTIGLGLLNISLSMTALVYALSLISLGASA